MYVVCTDKWMKKLIHVFVFLGFILLILQYKLYKTDHGVIISVNRKKHQHNIPKENANASKYPSVVRKDIRTEDIMNERKHNLRDACKDLNLSQRIQGSSLAHLQQVKNIFVLPKFKMIYCAVPKVVSTSWKRFFLAAHGHTEFLNKTRRNEVGPHIFFNQKFTKLSSLSKQSAERVLKEYKSFLFVRNPYTRILSAYRDKFKWPPNKFNDFFQSRVRKWLKSNEPALANVIQTGPISFEAFVRYYLKASSKNEHWEDMYKLCQPCTIDYDFIGHYETLESDMVSLMENMHSDIHFPDSMVSRKPTFSSDEQILTKFYSHLPRHLMESLTQSEGIKRDCKIFGYSIPKCTRRNN